MEIIKKLGKRKAWIRIDDGLALLIQFTKDKTDDEMIAAGQIIKNKRDRLKQVQKEIEKLKR